MVAASIDEPNLVSAAGLVPAMRLAAGAGLHTLAENLLPVPTDKGSNAGGKVSALVAGMVAGADSIDDMALLRHGAMSRVFERPYAPSTLGSFLRTFTIGHVRQVDGSPHGSWALWCATAGCCPGWARPCWSTFAANSAWLVCAVMAFNLTRAAGAIAGGTLATATTGTIRRTLIAVPARAASSARRLRLHLRKNWPWQRGWTQLFTHT